PNDAFFFAGFLPSKDKARRDRLAELAGVPATLLFFESPHRIAATLVSAADVLGDSRPACVCRELTKTFEEFRRGTLGELAAHYAQAGAVKGEIVLVIGPPGEAAAPEAEDVDRLLAQLVKDMPAGKAATEAARQTGLPRRDLYQRLLDLKDGDAR
ncbi:16S rRNA (cytidine(1402)-2'-O)-methyltransferase, partial [Shinella sp.]